MHFHGLMLLRDEEDVIAQNLEHLLSWIDALYILDLGSTDATWDIVQQFAARDSRIVPFHHSPIVYSDNLRSMIFDHYRDRFEPGDWVMKIDADEFYHILPPQFVRERLRPLETAVLLQWYFFRLTTEELADYESGRVDVMKDRGRPIAERRRYYKISEYFEPRMFQYRRSMRWADWASFPFNAGFVARERIPIRHYPHRDPLQMERRFQLRAAMMRLNALAGGHWKLEDWRKDIPNKDGIEQSAGVGLADMPSVVSGPLNFWTPGTSLVEQPLHNHIPKMHKRLAQRIVHPLLLPLLDRTRDRFDPNFRPTPVPTIA